MTERSTLKQSYYELYENNYDQVFNFILKYTNDLERAKDLTYQVFVETWNVFCTNKGRLNRSAMIYEIARDKVLAEYRERFSTKQEELFLIKSTKKGNS